MQSLVFDNAAIRKLPVDCNTERQVKSSVAGFVYSFVDIENLDAPVLVATSAPAFALLGIDPDDVDDGELARYFGGSGRLYGSVTYAHCYAGHQFGFFAGQLGDGAATSLGEVVSSTGRWELQLKGAGKTPYSRQGDGRKVLRSSLREFLCSEAMHALGIPTTRAACIVTSSTQVERDALYSGHPKLEAASVVLRLAPTFMRFGSFEIFKSREESNTERSGPSAAHPTLLPQMLDFVTFYHFRDIWTAAGGGGSSADAPADRKGMYVALFEEVVTRTAALVAGWQCVGFCHGVLNTDNMSILGLTLDYGPFGFLEHFSNGHVCNGSDDQGRYRFGAQPAMCEWNCKMLGEALRPVLPRAEARQALAKFWPTYAHAFTSQMRAKLGLLQVVSGGGGGEDEEEAEDSEPDERLVHQLIEAMQASGSDFTLTFRALGRVPMPAGQSAAAVVDIDSVAPDVLDDGGALEAILKTCTTPCEAASMTGSRMQPQQLKLLAQLAAREPVLLISMGMSPQDVQREVEKADEARALADMTPDVKAANDRRLWSAWLRQYSRRLGQERLAGTTPEQRAAAMDAANPKLVLRNWVAQVAVERAEAGDYSLARRILALLLKPFGEYSDEELTVSIPRPGETEPLSCRLDMPPPDAYKDLRVTCSS